MPQFSPLEMARLATVDQRLRGVFMVGIQRRHIAILVGWRGQAEQHEAFIKGESKLDWPLSPHNRTPSVAVDFAPVVPGRPIDWKDRAAFGLLAGYLIRIGEDQGVKLRWGGDWSGDGQTSEESLQDLDHIEIVEG